MGEFFYGRAVKVVDPAALVKWVEQHHPEQLTVAVKQEFMWDLKSRVNRGEGVPGLAAVGGLTREAVRQQARSGAALGQARQPCPVCGGRGEVSVQRPRRLASTSAIPCPGCTSGDELERYIEDRRA